MRVHKLTDTLSLPVGALLVLLKDARLCFELISTGQQTVQSSMGEDMNYLCPLMLFAPLMVWFAHHITGPHMTWTPHDQEVLGVSNQDSACITKCKKHLG